MIEPILGQRGARRPPPQRLPLLRATVSLGALLAGLAGCGGAETGDTAGEAPPSFTRVRDEVLTPSCAFSSCHGNAGASAGLDLTDDEGLHGRLVGVAAQDAPDAVLVVPGDAAGSYLWQKCAATDGIVGDAMPLGQASGLDAARLDLLAAWIDAGASAD